MVWPGGHNMADIAWHMVWPGEVRHGMWKGIVLAKAKVFFFFFFNHRNSNIFK